MMNMGAEDVESGSCSRYMRQTQAYAAHRRRADKYCKCRQASIEQIQIDRIPLKLVPCPLKSNPFA